MLISKFNKLIRSKILWTILAVTIAFAFVGAGVMSKMGDGASGRERAAEGTLFGDKVSGEDFYVARYFELGMRPMTDNSEEAVKLLRDRTWRRLAALRMAERMGIQISDDAIREVITNDPTFASNGAFDQRRYMAFLQNQLRVDAATFERYLRQDLTLRQLMSALRTATWTAPYEVGPRLARLTDAVQLEYVLIPSATETNDVEVSEADLTAYFEEYKEAFRIGEQLSVRYVSFPVSNLLASIEISDADIDDYYNDNIEDYSSSDTNGVEQVEPLEDVRASIVAIVTERQARFETKDEATRFVMALAPDRYGQAYEMGAAATSRGITVMTSEWFTAEEAVPGLDAGQDLTDAAFKLVPNDPERYFSDAIAGDDAVYVIADHDSRPARDPQLEEVRDQVVGAATLKAAEEAFEAGIAAAREQLIAAVADTNSSFMVKADALGLMAATTSVFTVYEGLPDDTPYSTYALSEIIDAKQGGVTEAVDTPDGMLIAHVASRTAGDPSAAEMLRPQYLRSMDQYRAAAVFEDWRDQVLAEADFEDFHPLTK
ncbi:MAG: hypothetical protein HN919_16815 [Verrucomicrobia bacterium]|nr:hypothetical protein [Verrucomicrobiota bacterium]MBT7067963.1 hypothetical protein [Verrucomicrobiota bacterium]MBT7699926.1 hypothetical protein [Verrucomicrobiota bacterium]